MRARFLSPAVNEMFDAAVFYEKQVADLCEQPEGWPDIGDGVRRRPLRRFPYSVLYRIDEGEIVIVALMHQRRRPHYWIGRL